LGGSAKPQTPIESTIASSPKNGIYTYFAEFLFFIKKEKESSIIISHENNTKMSVSCLTAGFLRKEAGTESAGPCPLPTQPSRSSASVSAA
jgi:hypothetical protein